MEFERLNDLDRIRDLGTRVSWVPPARISPDLVEAGIARGRMAQAHAVRGAFRALGRVLARWARRVVPRVPAGAHGPDGIDFDCAHGRPC